MDWSVCVRLVEMGAKGGGGVESCVVDFLPVSVVCSSYLFVLCVGLLSRLLSSGALCCLLLLERCCGCLQRRELKLGQRRLT